MLLLLLLLLLLLFIIIIIIIVLSDVSATLRGYDHINNPAGQNPRHKAATTTQTSSSQAHNEPTNHLRIDPQAFDNPIHRNKISHTDIQGIPVFLILEYQQLSLIYYHPQIHPRHILIKAG